MGPAYSEPACTSCSSVGSPSWVLHVRGATSRQPSRLASRGSIPTSTSCAVVIRPCWLSISDCTRLRVVVRTVAVHLGAQSVPGSRPPGVDSQRAVDSRHRRPRMIVSADVR